MIFDEQNMKKSCLLHSSLGGHEKWKEAKVLLKAFIRVRGGYFFSLKNTKNEFFGVQW